MSHYTLLTGATGLVGRFLTRDLLLEGQRLAVLVRPSKKETARERVEATLQIWEAQTGRPLPRPVCLPGDVTAPGLGLSTDARRWLDRNCDRVIHNAAVLTFQGQDRQGDPWKTNLEGTRQTLDFCRELGVRDFHYVSTAYVCGKRQGVIREDELEQGQEFRNDYEQSKYLAEKMVRAADLVAPPTIYRPVVISGDFETGYTNTYHGVYLYLRLIALLLNEIEPGSDGRRHTPFSIGLRGDEQRNIVPVDWVSRVICHLVDNPHAHGRTYHLAPRVCLTTRDVLEAGYSYFNSYGVEFRGPDWNDYCDDAMIDRSYLTHTSSYRDYELTDPQFDTSNLDRFAGHLPCPVIDEAALHRYWRYGEQDRWGKRAPQKIQVPMWGEDTLADALSRIDRLAVWNLWQHAGLSEQVIGLDVLGPGGGQWQIRYQGQGSPVVAPGLPRNGEPVFRLTVDKLASITGSGKQPQQSARRRPQRLVRALVSYVARDRGQPAVAR